MLKAPSRFSLCFCPCQDFFFLDRGKGGVVVSMITLSSETFACTEKALQKKKSCETGRLTLLSAIEFSASMTLTWLPGENHLRESVKPSLEEKCIRIKKNWERLCKKTKKPKITIKLENRTKVLSLDNING